MALHLRDVTVAYGQRRALANAALRVEEGACVGLIGPNSSGKSTLLKVMARLLRPLSGTVTLNDEPLWSLAPRRVARVIAFLPQHPQAPPELTVRELVGLGRHPHVRWLAPPGPVDKRAVDDALTLCDLRALADRPLGALSGGERQRAWLAMTVAQTPRYLLLDEPLTFLDIGHQLEALELVRRLNQTLGLAVVMVLHDLNLAARYCQRLVALQEGKIACDGTPGEVLKPCVVEPIYHVRAHIRADALTGSPSCVFFPRP